MEPDAGVLHRAALVVSELGRADRFTRFLHRAGGLKFVPRTGWLDRGMPSEQVESVADHSWRVALMAWLLAADNEALDRDRVLKLALIHDLAEAITGDITPYDPATLDGLDAEERRRLLDRRHVATADRKAAKRGAEQAAMDDLIADLPPALRQEMTELWSELRERATPEARFVKEIDILETYLQSREYHAGDVSLPMESFAAEALAEVRTSSLHSIRDAVDTAIDQPERGARE
jgi:putative hydrolases of HD superfamily